MVTIQDAKMSLDDHIKKQRSAFYKPIQVAEILYHTCCREEEVSCVREIELTPQQLLDKERYRNPSKRWRDEITLKLVGNVSTSSQKFQDNLFEENAIPPIILAMLAEENCRYPHIVERYIYQAFWLKLSEVQHVAMYLEQAKSAPNTFELTHFFELFEGGLRRSIDKAYEIVVYALFDALVRHLKARVSLSIDTSSSQTLDLLQEFEDFARLVLGVDEEHLVITKPAAFYRAGVTNAADRGVDIWANFGPVVQVKHLSLSTELAENISEGIRTDWIIIVCQDAEEATLNSVLHQLGIKVRAIITQRDLNIWYQKALKGSYASLLADDLLYCLLAEFSAEFPSISEFESFYTGRGYDKIKPCESSFWRSDPWIA